MKIAYLFFAAHRYWSNDAELQAAYQTLSSVAKDAPHALITDAPDSPVIPEADCIVAVPMSGAVQRIILNAAENASIFVLYGAYIRGNAPDVICTKMLYNNAAPALMDTWGVIRRTFPHAMLALDEALDGKSRTAASISPTAPAPSVF